MGQSWDSDPSSIYTPYTTSWDGLWAFRSPSSFLPPPPSSVAAHRNMMASATGFEVDRSYLLRVHLGPRERTCVVFFGRCRAPDCSYPCTSLARLELLRWFAFYCVGLRGHVCAPCFMGIFVFHSCLGLSRTVYKRNAFGARMGSF